MRRCWISIAAVVLAAACASSDPAPVQVLGAPEDLVPLTGEWVGTYEGRATGRSGSITFHLTENPKGAHGDVLFVPQRDVVYREERHAEQQQHHPGPFGGPVVLSIEFVRIAAGEISGRIAPYADPEDPLATLETHFAGHLDGEWIEGTFVTYSSQGVSPRRGTWRVHRRPAS